MTDFSALTELGWSPHWQALYEPHIVADMTPARVVRSDRGSSLVATLGGIIRAKPSVHLKKASIVQAEMPVVGDWVAVLASEDLEVPLMEAVLERSNAITRGDPGNPSELQVLAANIDIVFVIHPIAEPPNLRRIERELSLAWNSGAIPVLVLTKMDLSSEPDTSLKAVQTIAFDVDVVLLNALDIDSTAQLLTYIKGHRTAVMFGPSGAGKSTLINTLLGQQRQATNEVRVGDGRGRHTTVTRELIGIPGHGVIIDTPGLRALGQTGTEEGISSAFPEIDQLAGSCRFRDCSHSEEPGCAVQSAVESGTLPPERLASYHKLVSEARAAAIKTDARLKAEEGRKGRIISRAAREYFKRHGRDE